MKNIYFASLVLLIGFFSLQSCSKREKVHYKEPTYATTDITTIQATKIGQQIVERVEPLAKDISQLQAEILTDESDAFYVQGHFWFEGNEYKFGVPIHFISGDVSVCSNWEWAKMEIVKVGTAELYERRGSWDYSMSK